MGGWARGASSSAAESRRARGCGVHGGVGLEWTQARGLAVAVDEVLSTGRMIQVYGWSWRGAGILVRRKCYKDRAEREISECEVDVGVWVREV